MSVRVAKRLRDAYGACQEITSFIDGVSLETYLQDRGLRLIVERLPGIAGEALNHALRSDPEMSSEIPEAQVIIGMRNRLIHRYDQIRDWDAAAVGAPALQAQLEHILKQRGWD